MRAQCGGLRIDHPDRRILGRRAGLFHRLLSDEIFAKAVGIWRKFNAFCDIFIDPLNIDNLHDWPPYGGHEQLNTNTKPPRPPDERQQGHRAKQKRINETSATARRPKPTPHSHGPKARLVKKGAAPSGAYPRGNV